MNINVEANIPSSNPLFQSFIESFVFNCPSATVVSKKKDKNKKYKSVSARECSFRLRGITGTLLNTMTAQIKKRVEFYQKVDNGQKVEDVFDSNRYDEKIVFKGNNQMSDAEVVFYYIRNAFAHGSFEYVPDANAYKLESKRDGVVKAQILLKEDTLKKLSELASLDKKSIEAFQKKRKNKIQKQK